MASLISVYVYFINILSLMASTYSLSVQIVFIATDHTQ
jgi:hypothetical protein